ncbi:MAG: DUF2442 domain-containing protein [Lachnospiraceae bacterium]|nr:DUF2442 domain-containing protein [Lachnospiraceae bacterium]
MLRPTAVRVKPEKNYKVRVDFDNGEQRLFDVEPYIIGSWYSRLSDQVYFKTVRTDGFTIVWPEGQDICPDDLYYSSVPVE